MNLFSVLSWKTDHHRKESRDYLEEEYVDLDWKEVNPKKDPGLTDQQVMSDQPVLPNQDRKRVVKNPWIEGSGDDNDDEDSRKEIGSGEFGKKKCFFFVKFKNNKKAPETFRRFKKT